MPEGRSHILTIAGFDPSGGAGVLADVKTFEQHKLLGMAVNTANTVQNDADFRAVNWLTEDEIFGQLEILLERFRFSTVKVGLIPSMGMIPELKKRLGENTRIIWDPVLSASAGFDFNHVPADPEAILREVFMITPNWEEVVRLSGREDAMEGAKYLSGYCNVYLKGGHNAVDPGRDFLFVGGKQFNFRPVEKRVWPKHGSGCILSSALAANLERGYPILKACLRAKRYTEQALVSNQGLLAWHKR